MATSIASSEQVCARLKKRGYSQSKSLKLYLAGYRNEGHFCEALAVKIRDDVADALELPSDKVRVKLEQKARGGITITATS